MSGAIFSIYQKQMNITMKPTKLPNPRPTQPTKNRLKGGIWATFFPQQIMFRGLGFAFTHGKQFKRRPTQPNYPQTKTT